MKLLPAAARSSQPWKNGLGVSQVIATDPEGAGFDTLRWQVSTTGFGADCPFSSLPGLDRWFTLIEGAGVELQCEDVPAGKLQMLRVDRPFVPHAFRGDWRTDCRMLGGAVRVLNVMCRRGGATAVVEMVKAEGELPLVQRSGETLLALLLQGHATCNAQPLSVLDGVLLDAGVGGGAKLQLSAGSCVALVRLVTLSAPVSLRSH